MASFVKKRADHEKEMAPRPLPDVSYGMCIRLGQHELDRAGLDVSKIDDGDVLAMTKVKLKVTAVHKEEGNDCIEASIIAGEFEDETAEEKDEEE